MGWLLMVSVISRREIPCKVLWGKSVVSGLSSRFEVGNFQLEVSRNVMAVWGRSG